MITRITILSCRGKGYVFFSPFLREKRYPSKSRSPRKNDYRRAQGIRSRSAGAFDARSKMDLRGRGREREKRCSFRAKKDLLVFNSQFAIVGPFFFSLSVFQVAKWNFFLHFRRKTVK